MLTQEQFDAWLVALRSGKYQQGREQLRTEDSSDPATRKYCCLGVLSERLGRLDAFGQDVPPDNQDITPSDCYVAEDLIEQVQQEPLVHLNDTKEASFLEIAEYLEESKAKFIEEGSQDATNP